MLASLEPWQSCSMLGTKLAGEKTNPKLTVHLVYAPQFPCRRRGEQGFLTLILLARWDDVFPLKSRRQGATSGSVAPSPAAAGREKSGNVVDEDEQRRLLMGGKKIDNRGKSPYKSEGRGGDIGGAASAAMQAKSALMERGEKLSELQVLRNSLQLLPS